MQTGWQSRQSLAWRAIRLLNDHLSTRAALYNQVLTIVHHRAHVCRETIASSREGHDVTPVLRSVSKGFAEHKDVLAQVCFLDKGIRPDGFHKLVLGNHLSTVTNQDQQRFKDFRRDGHGLVFAQQNLLVGIYPKRSELVENFGFCNHAECAEAGFRSGGTHRTTNYYKRQPIT